MKYGGRLWSLSHVSDMPSNWGELTFRLCSAQLGHY